MEQRVNSLFQKVQCSAFRAEPEHNHDKFVCCMNINALLKQKHWSGDVTRHDCQFVPSWVPLLCSRLGVGEAQDWGGGWSHSGHLVTWLDLVTGYRRLGGGSGLCQHWPTSPASLLKTQLVLTAFRDSNWQGWMILRCFFLLRKCKIKSAKHCYARVFLICLLIVSEGQFSLENFKLSNLNFFVVKVILF